MSRMRLAFLSFMAILTVVLYQNCGEGGFEARTGFSKAPTDNGELDIENDDPMIEKTFEKKVAAQPIYANRLLMYNIFSSIFGPSIKSELVRSIAWSGSEMGSGFNTYEKVLLTAADCNKKRNPLYRCDNYQMERRIEPISGAGAVREGRRMSACHLGVENNAALQFAFKKIDSAATLAKPPEVNDKNLYRVFQLFYRGRPLPNKQFLDALRIAYNQGEDEADGWRAVILGICLSPHWQVL